MKGLIDSTLREGLQSVGVSLSRKQKEDILHALGRVGIEEIEIGIATPADADISQLISLCRKHTPNTSISLWSRCIENDISCAAKLHPDILSISIPASDLHIEKKFKTNREWALKTLEKSITFALNSGIPKVSVGFEDATRADDFFLRKLTKTAHKAGAFRIRLADTVGIASPALISSLVTNLKKDFPVEVGVHTHNDFGMATANAIAALETGADWADVSALGLGERTGCARLEEIAAFLSLKKNKNYKVSELSRLSQLAAKYSGRNISPNRPVIGSDIFTCETGLHLLGLEEDPRTYEPYKPEYVGAKRRLIYGSKIGRKNILHRLSKLNSSATLSKLDQVFSRVKDKATKLGRPLNDQEFLAACRE